MHARKVRNVVIIGAAVAMVGCESVKSQLADGYQLGDATRAVAYEAVRLHELGCNGDVSSARAALLDLYRVLLNPEYPPGGVCDDPLGVLVYAAGKTQAPSNE